MQKESVLKKKIDRIESLLNISKLIDEDANSIEKIQK